MKNRVLSILLSITLTLLPCDIVLAKSPLIVAFLDVGQGDAIYIEAPNGNQMLIDGGPKDALMNVLPDYMPLFDRSIDVVMVTNPDTDHYSGFLSLLDSYEVGVVIEPGTISKTPTHAVFQEKIVQMNIPQLLARKGMTIVLDPANSVTFTVLFPDRDVSKWVINDGSIEGILTYGKTKVFFTGDGSEKTEGIIMSSNSKEVLKSDILKIAHHGSRTATADDFVAAVAPTHAVISNGKNNTYGHPHNETLETLKRHNIGVHRTDLEGTIVFTSNGDTFSKTTAK